jgi:hypothetical protein
LSKYVDNRNICKMNQLTDNWNNYEVIFWQSSSNSIWAIVLWGNNIDKSIPCG